MSIIEINQETCVRCGACVAACGSTIILPQKSGIPRLFPGADQFCMHCGHCVSICPTASVAHRDLPLQECLAIDPNLEISFQQISQLIKTRRSIREFSDEPVRRERLEALLEVVRFAPTGHNIQGVRWLIVDQGEKLRELTDIGYDWARSIAGGNDQLSMQMQGLLKMHEYGVDLFLRNAPVLVIACADGQNQMSGLDCAIAMNTFDLVAHSAGLGCFWNGYFLTAAQSFDPMTKTLGIPPGEKPYAVLCLGYPRFKYHRIPPRKPATIRFI